MGEKRMQCNEGDSERDESTEEPLQCKKAVFMDYDTVSFFLWPLPWPCLCTESMPEATS